MVWCLIKHRDFFFYEFGVVSFKQSFVKTGQLIQKLKGKEKERDHKRKQAKNITQHVGLNRTCILERQLHAPD
jgi:hypothetical protein